MSCAGEMSSNYRSYFVSLPAELYLSFESKNRTFKDAAERLTHLGELYLETLAYCAYQVNVIDIMIAGVGGNSF